MSALSLNPRSFSRRSLTPWLFVSPFLLGFAVFTIYPLLASLVLSMERTFGPGASAFVGFSNYTAMFRDPLFYKAMGNTVLFTLGSLLVQLPLALGLALALEAIGPRFRGLMRAILFSPSVVGVAFAASIFVIVFEKRTGILNVVLHKTTGFKIDFAWLQDHIMLALVVAALWMYTGFNMVFFSAALQNVRRDLIEAAMLDGAGPIHRFIHVTIPAIRPVAGFVVLLSVIGSFQLFELPYLMLNNTGGPDNRGLTVVLYLYQNGFETGDLGYASAIGWALSVVLILCAAGQRLLVRPEEGEK